MRNDMRAHNLRHGASLQAGSGGRKPLSVFISCADEERELLLELEKHLTVLERCCLIVPGSLHDVLPGDRWESSLREKLDSADLLLLMLSPSFLASARHNEEIRHAVARHRAGQAVVVPILVRPCLWPETPLGELTPLPRQLRAVTQHEDRDAVWVEIAGELRRLLPVTPPPVVDPVPQEVVPAVRSDVLDVRFMLTSSPRLAAPAADGWADVLGRESIPRAAAIRPMLHSEEPCHAILLVEAYTSTGSTQEIEIFLPDCGPVTPGCAERRTGMEARQWCSIPERPIVETSQGVARWRLSLVVSTEPLDAMLDAANVRSGPEDLAWMSAARALLSAMRAPALVAEVGVPLLTARGYEIAPSTRAVRLTGKGSLLYTVDLEIR